MSKNTFRNPLLPTVAVAALSAFLTACAPKAGSEQAGDFPAVEPAQGRELFMARCGACHGLPVPSSESAEEWPGIMESMAPKSRLDSAQSAAVLQYILAARSVTTK